MILGRIQFELIGEIRVIDNNSCPFVFIGG